MINKNFNKLLMAYFLSTVGDWLYRLALPIFLFNQTKSALIMAVAYGVTFIPYILVTPFGGVIADRFKRQKLLIISDIVAFILTLILAFTIMKPEKNLSLIYVLVFLIASVASLLHPIFQSFIPNLVKKEDLSKANSLLLMVDNLILIIGPVFSGVVITLLGSVTAVYLNAVSFLLSALINFTIIPLNPEIIANIKFSLKTVFKDLSEGLRYTVNNSVIKYGCILFVFINFGIQIFYANFIYYLVEELHLNPSEVGITIAISGFGAIIGSITAPKLVKYFAQGNIILGCSFGVGISILFLLLVNNFMMIGFIWGIQSACSSVIIITYFTLRQQMVPNQYLGRTIAITRLISYLAIPIASLVGGIILQYTNQMHYLIFIGGTTIIITAVLGVFSPLNNRHSYTYKDELYEKI